MKTTNEHLGQIIDLVMSSLREPGLDSEEAVKAKLEELLQIVVKSFSRTCRGLRATVWLVDPDESKPRLYVAIGQMEKKDHLEKNGQELEQAETFCSWVNSLQEGRLINSGQQLDDSSELGQYFHYRQINSLLAAPMILQGKCIGVISLESTFAGIFDEVDLDFLKQAADFFALLIQQKRQAAVKHERDLYLCALYAAKKQEILRHPTRRTEEQIKALLASEDTFLKLIEEVVNLQEG